MIALEQFLMYGELGPVRVGMGANEVADALGPADARAPGKSVSVLQYGALQLALSRHPDRVSSITLQFQPQDQPIPEAARPNDFVPSAATTEEELRNYLDSISFPPHSSVGGENARHLVLQSGARVSFVDGRMASIQFAKRLNSRTVSVSLSEAAFRSLRELARSENRTLSELCTEVLNERASELQHG